MNQPTPMLQQYFSMKEKYPDALLFFRMGDFYEMFFEDAEKASRLLDITLTTRGKHQGENIPMCGVPHHASESYIHRLIEQGVKVAVCDQVEDPRKAKGIVARDVTRVVTPGMVVSPEFDEPKNTRYLAALAGPLVEGGRTAYGLAALELSTGEFRLTQVGTRQDLFDELARLGPSELLISESDQDHLFQDAQTLGYYITPFEEIAFDYPRAMATLTRHFGEHALTGFGVTEMKAGLCAAGAAMLYAAENQRRDLTHVDRIRGYRLDDFMVLDESTKRNLELFQSMRDNSRKGSLLGLLDLTVTAMGGRKFRQWLSYPLLERTGVAERHDAVEALILDGLARGDLRDVLGRIQDLERLTGRISLGRATPRDMASLKSSLQHLPHVKGMLSWFQGLIGDLGRRLDELTDVAALIDQALVEEPPLNLKDGGLFKPGFSAELDDLMAIMADGKGWIAAMEQEERERTGISSLKVGYNRVFGYYIEITKANFKLVPEDYIRKQTLAGAERYITPQLKEQEEKVLGASERRAELEQELFEQLRLQVAGHAARIRASAEISAQVDVLAALAEGAVKYDYTRPELLDDDRIEIVGGRHPVIEQTLKNEAFVANDLNMDNRENQVMIITGPNMAGKSTILRQTALIVLMAQIGSFVPADTVRMGLVNRIFTRVGASDDLTRGRSTFMVEMNETAQILNQATPKSLVILDEIGRGTSTFDGLSIAWAVAEYLHDLAGRGVRTMFATHYHELVQLSQTKSRVRNYNVAVKEYNGQVIFLRKLQPGGTSRSYGIAVARLAGLPTEVLERAQEVLENLEKGGMNVSGIPRLARTRKKTPSFQLELFEPASDDLAEAVRDMDIDAMTPLGALNKLAELKRMAK